MHATLRALLDLQEIDRRIFAVARELERLPVERSRAEAELERRRTRIADLQAQVREQRTRIKEIEDRTSTQRQRIRKVEQEAASARADVPLQVAYQHEIRTLRRDVSNAEEEALELIGKVEELEAEIGALRGELSGEEKVFEELARNVESEMSDARRRLEAMQAERKSRMSSEVSPEALDLYRRLLVARGGEAMAELDGRLCQVCFMEVPTNLAVRLMRGSELIQCPSCDRILVPRS
jgi:predicted  nucleic acid-binding Zn-ribbon protein